MPRPPQSEYQRLAYLRRTVPRLQRELDLLEALWAATSPPPGRAFTGKVVKGLPRGGKHKSAWVTKAEVANILAQHKAGLSNIAIARATGWHPNTISDIVRGKKKGV